MNALASLDLLPALAIAGGVALLALALHGWWRARRQRPRGAPVAGARVEPGLGSGAATPLGGGDSAGPALDDKATPPPPRPRRAVLRLDALIDAIVPMELEAPVSGEHLLAHLPPTRRAGSKPFYIEALDTETGEWDHPQPGRRYSELQAGVQLAHRGGPLNQIEYSEFVQKIQAFAEAVGATALPPDMVEVAARAKELDALASPLDAQLTITLRSNGAAWSLPYLEQVAGRLGFVKGPVPGRLVLPAPDDAAAPPVLVLAYDARAALADTPQQQAVASVLLSLDVPQTPEAAEPFPAWHHAATTLAADLDATAMDDAGRAVTLHAYAAIGQDLQQLYRRLEQLDLAAGSAAARRLFS